MATVSRLSSVNSSERYFLWDSALEAASSKKLTGIGPGSFEYWWAREGDGQQFVRDAHNLYLEMLAEAGPLAFLLILALIFGPIGYGILLSVRAGSTERRATLAAATAGMAAFAVAAGVDWAWEMTVLPVAFFALAATALGPREPFARRDQASRRATRPGQPPVVRETLASHVQLRLQRGASGHRCHRGATLASTQALESSQALFREGDLEQSLAKAERARETAALGRFPRVQQAQILGLLGRQTQAARLAREAIERESVHQRMGWCYRICWPKPPPCGRSARERASESESQVKAP